MDLKDKKINFLGDSITEGVGTSSPERIYLNLLKEKVGLAEARNYGISATRYADFEGSDPYCNAASFSQRFAQMDDDADIVVVFGATNDFGHGNAPFGTFEDRTPGTFYGACHYLYSGLIRKYLGKQIVIMTPLHRCNELSKRGDVKKQDVGILKDYVDIIREVAEYYSLPVLDLFSTSGLQPAIKEIQETYIPDGLHPNDAGHQVIAQKLEAFLKNL